MKRTIPTIHLMIFLFLLIAVGVTYYFARNELHESNVAEAEINNLVENREKLTALEERLPGLITETDVWLEALPDDEESVALFASRLEEIARSRSVIITLDIEDFPESVDVGGKFMPGLGTMISLEGSFEGVRAFMTDLSRLNYYYKTDKITILKHESKPGVKATFNGSLMMNLEL